MVVFNTFKTANINLKSLLFRTVVLKGYEFMDMNINVNLI